MAKWLHNLVRIQTLIGTTISFAVFMSWGFCLGVLLFPLIRLAKGPRARKIFLQHVRFTWRVFVNLMRVTRGFGCIRVLGKENLPKDIPCLLIGNHLTLVDIVVLGAYVRDFNCVVKMSLWKHPFFGAVVNACDFVPNAGSEEFIARCQEGFNENRPLVVFPQGERTVPDKPMKFQRGAAQIAVRTGVAVHPVYISCEPLMLAKGVPWYRVPAAPELIVRIGTQLVAPPEIEAESSIPKKVRALNSFWEQHFDAVLSRIDDNC